VREEEEKSGLCPPEHGCLGEVCGAPRRGQPGCVQDLPTGVGQYIGIAHHSSV
jgi:hypothetical protein